MEKSIRCLKSDLDKVKNGKVTTIITENIHNFQYGDYVTLLEYSPLKQLYTGNYITVFITEIVMFSDIIILPENLIAFSFEKLC